MIRYPSYLGLLLGLFSWALVFRSTIGVLVALLLLPPPAARMNSEEALLESEFRERYAGYRRRTWQRLPFLTEPIRPGPPSHGRESPGDGSLQSGRRACMEFRNVRLECNTTDFLR